MQETSIFKQAKMKILQKIEVFTKALEKLQNTISLMKKYKK